MAQVKRFLLHLRLNGLSLFAFMSNSNCRVLVINPDGSPAMPAKASRVRRWLTSGKVKVYQNDLGVFAVQLVQEPSGRNTQEVALGLDPGSSFTGIAVQTAHTTLIGLNLDLPREEVSKRMAQRATLRRTRRGRRIQRQVPFKQRNHRSKRFDNRRQSKLSPSIRASKQLELRIVSELCKLIPVSQIFVEVLTKSDSPGFTRAAQGQTFLLKELLVYCPTVHRVEGFDTSTTREFLKLPKSKNKSERSPAAHVSDAIAMASRAFIRYVPNTAGTQTGYAWRGAVEITHFSFAVVSRFGSRPRKMHDLTIKKGGVRDSYGGFNTTHPYSNGDYVEYRTSKKVVIGYISANNIYQYYPKKQRLLQLQHQSMAKNLRLLRFSSNLAVVNIPGGAAFLPHSMLRI